MKKSGPGMPPEEPETLDVEVVPDGRLRTRIHWQVEGSRVRIRVPRRIPKRDLERHVAEILEQVRRRRARTRRRADAELEAMARELNQACFDGALSWQSIRWVGNMRKRLGSCSSGGATDGDIRISDRIRGWPRWVIEYVVAHELAHRRFPNHSPEFYAYLGRYPRAERAQGFLMGAAFQLGEDAEEWL